MKRIALITASLLVGAVVGAVLMLATQSVSSTNQAAPDVTTTTTSARDPAAPTTSTPPPSPTTTPNAPPISDQVLLVWTPGALPQGFPDRVAAISGVSAVTIVTSDLAHLAQTASAGGETVDRPPAGFVIPLEVMGFDPSTYPAFFAKKESSAFLGLTPGQIILSSTSARLRRLGPGGTLTFEDGSRFTVAAVVDDVLIGAAEAALPVEAADALGVGRERYLLVRHSGTRKGLEASIRAALPDGMAVRIRAPGETPVLRHGDAVLPQVLIKDQFGEFAFRPGDGQSFEIEPGWVNDNISTAEVPLLGIVTCHRNLLPALRGAMGDLEELNLGFLIDPDDFRGCFNARYIANRKGISRHAWGAAADLNIGSNPEGLDSVQDPRLIQVMERWGFTSGLAWLIPDPGHFEYVQPPQRR